MFGKAVSKSKASTVVVYGKRLVVKNEEDRTCTCHDEIERTVCSKFIIGSCEAQLLTYIFWKSLLVGPEKAWTRISNTLSRDSFCLWTLLLKLKEGTIFVIRNWKPAWNNHQANPHLSIVCGELGAVPTVINRATFLLICALFAATQQLWRILVSSY